jgi:RNA polymerase sigma factor (sigma-70 family)
VTLTTGPASCFKVSGADFRLLAYNARALTPPAGAASFLSAPDFHKQSQQAQRQKTRWSLTPAAFEKLLNAFSADRDEAGVLYELMRRKLVRFFEWRKIEPAEDYADETINRVARRIESGEVIENLNGYFFGVARMVYLEALKDPGRVVVSIDDEPHVRDKKAPQTTQSEPRVLCFDQCLDSLPPENRTLIVGYYQEERRAKIELRQELADSLQIPLNALRIRAHRIRVRLEQCITQCMETPV